MQWMRASVVPMMVAVFVKWFSFAQMCVLVGPPSVAGNTLSLLMDEFGIDCPGRLQLLATQFRSIVAVGYFGRMDMQHKLPLARAVDS